MTYIDILKSLKVHKNEVGVADSFPPTIAQIFKVLSVYVDPKTLRRLNFSIDDYITFTTNFGAALYTKNFTYLDDIIIEFLEKYHYEQYPFKFFLVFPEDSKKKFNSEFERFRHESWENILEPMLDLIEELLQSGRVNNLKLNLY
jgi:hypothetical protein